LDALLGGIRRWWQRTTGEEDTPFDGDTPAWAVSLAFHILALLLLSAVFVRSETNPERPIQIVQNPEDPVEPMEDIPLLEDLVVAPEEESSGSKGSELEEAAQSLAPVLSDVSTPEPSAPEIPNSDFKVDLVEDFTPQGLELTESITVKGDVAVGTSGASGAVDRLTAEIAASLSQRPTLICWVFDQSVSLSAQRKEIASRLSRVFEELGCDGSEAHRPDLTHLVVAYGAKVGAPVAKPSKSSEEVVSAIESIPVDDSGVEMTFGAIAEAARMAKAARSGPPRRNVLIVVFTDEVGNDQHLADEVSAFCRSQAMMVYVVGVPAPFGRRQVEVRFVEFDERYAQDDQFPVVEQGPETLYPEVVRIGSLKAADEPMDSGFGPFSLSKICAETGGIYFSVHANRSVGSRVSDTAPMASRLRRFFDGDSMRHYKPEYLSAFRIDQMISSNKAKKALVEAAKSSAVGVMSEPKTVFPREDDGKLANLLSEAQRVAAVVSPKIDALYATLAEGQADRGKIQERRWQAGYDLAMGRVLAAKTRTDAYNIMLAQAKTGMKFKDPKNDTWTLVPSDKVAGIGSQAEKIAAQAKMYLERVVEEHPGTPWAFIAAEEIKTPMGYEWMESHTGVNSPKGGGGGGGGNPLPSDDKKKNLAPPKPKRQVRNI